MASASSPTPQVAKRDTAHRMPVRRVLLQLAESTDRERFGGRCLAGCPVARHYEVAQTATSVPAVGRRIDERNGGNRAEEIPQAGVAPARASTDSHSLLLVRRSG